MHTKYILDTSALIHDPCLWKQFANNSQVIIPIAVVNELDNLKKHVDDAGRNARVCIRNLDEISNLGDISKGIVLDNKVNIKVDVSYNNLADSNFGDPTYGDSHILHCAYSHYINKKSKCNVVLVSNDINLRIKAKARGIKSIACETNKITTDDLYSGILISDNEKAGKDLATTQHIDPKSYNLELYPNQCIAFAIPDGEMVLGRKVSANRIKAIKKFVPWDILARNKEQSLAIDLIMDKRLDLITFTGRAGCGKSLITLAAALELVLNKHEYNKLIVYRPIQSVGNEIGYVPGPQPLDAKILTPTGWTTMGQIKTDDFVVGSDGNAKKVLKVFPKGQKEVFRVEFSDNSYAECCEDHLWHTISISEKNQNSIGSVKSLKQIKDTLTVFNSKQVNHRIPIIQPVNFTQQPHIIDPYILGILLGDGTLSDKSSVYFTNYDAQMQINCSKLIPSNMICKSRSKNSYDYTFGMISNLGRKARISNIFSQEINRLKLRGTKSKSKFIPQEYLFDSIENRISILQGLMDTDGFVSSEGDDVQYYSTSNQLAEGVQFLIQSLGGISRIKKRQVYAYNKDKSKRKKICMYVVGLSLPQHICPFRLDRKIKRYKPRKLPIRRFITNVVPVGIKETQCILVDSHDHLYATNQLILTHNTIEEKLAPWFQATMDNFEVLLSGKSHRDWRRDFEMFRKKGLIELGALTYIRGRSIPNAIIFFDEVQNISKEEIKTVLTRAGEKTKIILAGDIEQIDRYDLDATNNGLVHVIEKFKDSDIAGHISFTQGERSKLATIASTIL